MHSVTHRLSLEGLALVAIRSNVPCSALVNAEDSHSDRRVDHRGKSEHPLPERALRPLRRAGSLSSPRRFVAFFFGFVQESFPPFSGPGLFVCAR
jgi:hypothetical protein